MNRFKLIMCVIAIVVFLMIVACGDVESQATASDIMSKLRTAIPEKEMIDGIIYLESGTLYESDSNVMSYEMIDELYKTNFDNVESYSVWITNDDVVTEIGVFKLIEENDVDTLINSILIRVDTLKEIAANLKPDEIVKVENAIVSSTGKYVYYLVTNINGILNDVVINEIMLNQMTA